MKPTFAQRVDLGVWRKRVKLRKSLRRMWRNERIRRDLRRDYGVSPYCTCGQTHLGGGREVRSAWRRIFLWSGNAWTLRAATLSQMLRDGVTVEHDCGNSTTCILCAAVRCADAA